MKGAEKKEKRVEYDVKVLRSKDFTEKSKLDTNVAFDMEVNDISAIHYPCPRYIEQPRKELVDRLTEADKQLILQAFVKNKEELEH